MTLNRTTIIGNLGQDPEMAYTGNGVAYTRFSLAVSRSYERDGERVEETEWFKVTAWNKLAELCNEYLIKGQKAYVDGRISLGEWSRSDGTQGASMEIRAENVVFLNKPQASNGEQYANPNANPSPVAPAVVEPPF